MTNNEVLLMDSDLFFDDLKSICHFSIDDEDELLELKNVLARIKSIDNNAAVICCTYGIDRSNEKLSIYCDNIWIKTILSVDELQEIFSKYDTQGNPLRGIVPSDISLLSVDDEEIKYVIYKDGTLKDYQEEKKQGIDEIKSLFWD